LKFKSLFSSNHLILHNPIIPVYLYSPLSAVYLCHFWLCLGFAEYTGIDMILMPHVHSNISITAKLGVINCQFYRFLRLYSWKDFFFSDGQSYCPPQE
jgi:hypothetical protein